MTSDASAGALALKFWNNVFAHSDVSAERVIKGLAGRGLTVKTTFLKFTHPRDLSVNG